MTQNHVKYLLFKMKFLRMSKFKHLKLFCIIKSSINEVFTDIFDIRSTHNSLIVFYLNTISSIAKQGEKHVENYANAIKNVVVSAGQEINNENVSCSPIFLSC